MHRVVITGAGAVSSLGADLSSNFESLSEGCLLYTSDAADE